MKERFLAAIDIGTNSFHLLIVKSDGKDFEPVYRSRIVLRLRDTSDSTDHIISEEKISEAIEVLRLFKEQIEKYNAETYAVATSAIRDAKNKDIVRERIYSKLGIELKILSGDDEAVLVAKAATYKKENDAKKILIFDLGGGGTEFIIVQNGNVIYKKSLQLGAVRFTQKHIPDFTLTSEKIDGLKREIRATLQQVKDDILRIGFDSCIGIGGTITSICWLIEKNVYNQNHNFKVLKDYLLSQNDFEIINKLVLGKATLAERLLIEGLDSKRADIIPVGCMIVNEIITSLQIDRIISSGYSIKEGVIIEAFERIN